MSLLGTLGVVFVACAANVYLVALAVRRSKTHVVSHKWVLIEVLVASMMVTAAVLLYGPIGSTVTELYLIVGLAILLKPLLFWIDRASDEKTVRGLLDVSRNRWFRSDYLLIRRSAVFVAYLAHLYQLAST